MNSKSSKTIAAWAGLMTLITYGGTATAQGMDLSGSASTDDGASADTTAESEPFEEEPPPPPPPPPPPLLPASPPPPSSEAMHTEEDTRSDHDQVVGSFGIGYMGYRQMLIGNATNGGTGVEVVTAPVVGARFWFTDGVGLDVGLGFSATDAVTQTQAGADSDLPGPFTAILHAGLPLALSVHQHFTFQVVPELNFGMAGNTIEGVGGADDQVARGMHFDIGARAGAEIQFGFIDIPQLSLQSGVGLALSYDATTYEDGTGTGEFAQMSFGTGVGDNPWNIFTANVAALYYF